MNEKEINLSDIKIKNLPTINLLARKNILLQKNVVWMIIK